MRVTFHALALSGSKILKVGRACGGDAKTVELSDEWGKYEVILNIEFDATEIIFTLVSVKDVESKVVDGEFVLDDVVVEQMN